jgi:hypothetical protein
VYSHSYEELINAPGLLRDGFSGVIRLRLDVTEDAMVEVRNGLGIPHNAQPYFVFLDRQGRILRRADVASWSAADSGPNLSRSLVWALATEPATPSGPRGG